MLSWLQAAYRGNTIGLPKFCPHENIPLINKNTLFNYLLHHHTPERTVLAGVGMEHGKLVEQAQKYFGDVRPTWDRPEIVAMGSKVDGSIAQYTGGIEKVM